MSSIASDRPVFPPSLKGQGTTAVVNATRALKEAQVAFFRPVANSAPTVTAQPAVEAAPSEPAQASQIKRPGYYLDIRV